MPNPRISDWKRNEVVRRRFSGFDRDKAAKGLVSAGGASNVMRAFEEMAEREGLTRAAEEYGVKDTIYSLIDQSKQKKKLGCSDAEIKQGLRIAQMIADLEIPWEKVPGVVKALAAIAERPKSKDFIDTLCEVGEHVEKTGLSYADVVPGYDASVAKIVARGEEERKKTDAHFAKKEEDQKRTTRQEAERLRRVTAEEGRKTETEREKQRGIGEKARSETSQLNAIIGKKEEEQRKLERVRFETKSVLEREVRIQEMDATFERLGVRGPEEKAAVLKEVERGGGDSRKLALLVSQHGSLEKAISTANSEKVAADSRKAASLSELGRVDQQVLLRKQVLTATDASLANERGVLQRATDQVATEQRKLGSLKSDVEETEKAQARLAKLQDQIEKTIQRDPRINGILTLLTAPENCPPDPEALLEPMWALITHFRDYLDRHRPASYDRRLVDVADRSRSLGYALAWLVPV